MKTQPLDVALTAALFGTWTETAQDRVDAFKKAIEREGFMMVPRDFGKEGLQADTFFDPNDPENVYGDAHELVADIGGHEVIEIGRSVQLPSQFALRIPVDDGDYEVDYYDTRAEAEAMHKSVYA